MNTFDDDDDDDDNLYRGNLCTLHDFHNGP